MSDIEEIVQLLLLKYDEFIWTKPERHSNVYNTTVYIDESFHVLSVNSSGDIFLGEFPLVQDSYDVLRLYNKIERVQSKKIGESELMKQLYNL